MCKMHVERILMIVAMTAAVLLPAGRALAQAGVEQETGASESKLQVKQLYNGVDRPMMIRVAEPGSIGEFSLVLLDAHHEVVSGPLAVRPGRVDLSVLMPEIWQLREAVYLQLLEYDRPTGSPVVLQPMLTRMVPVTKRAFRPGSTVKYTKIVGWRSEMEPAPVEDETAAGDETVDEDGKRDGGGNDDSSPSTTSAPLPAQSSLADVFATNDERLLTGLRAYSERDVELITTVGRVLLMMRPDEAPNTAWNFLQLCAGGFYREVSFHRVVPISRGQPFVIQAGDPTATGDGGAGYWLALERSELPHDFGVISMARADDPDSAGSQFFICLSREGTARLDGQYCAFGTALEGAETIWKIANSELADVGAGRPVDAPLILETLLVPAPARVPGQPRVAQWKQPEQPQTQPDKPARVPR